MSTGANKRIRKAIDILLQKAPSKRIYNPVTYKMQPFTINFITLTVSSHRNISINEGYRNLLKPYLRKLRKSGSISYIWKAEYQKRGQLHYHLTTNSFVHWQDIRNTWNNLQRKGRYLDDYALKYGHFDANSTDVHSVYKIRDIAAYLGKYMSKPVVNHHKTAPGTKVKYEKGKIWDCSKDLKLPQYSFVPDNRIIDEINYQVGNGSIKKIELDHCVIFKKKNPASLLSPLESSFYDLWKIGQTKKIIKPNIKSIFNVVFKCDDNATEKRSQISLFS